MILRNCVARHVRPTLSRPLSCSNIRRYTTTNDGRAGNGGSNEMMGGGGLEAGKAHAPVDLPPSSPLSASSKKKKKQKELQEVIMSLSADSSREHGGPSWTNTQQWGTSDELRTPAQQYADFERIQRTTRSLGTRVERRYVPTELINNPPGPEDVTLELLMASQTHMGHNTSLWNPANSRYIYGVRQGIHIISLETTAAHLRRAARVVEETSYRGGLILFVGNRAGQMEIVTKAAKMSGACHLFTKWTPGAITNRDVILKMQDIKVVDHMDRELDEFESFKGSARPLLPDLVVCLNPVENYTLLYECGLKSIPTIGIIDTNADPSWVTYTIPANDDSLRAAAVIAGVLGRAGQMGRRRRLEAAAGGEVTWRTSAEISRHMKKETQLTLSKRKQVMSRIQDQVEGFSDEEKALLRRRHQADAGEVDEAAMMEMLGAAASGRKPGQQEDGADMMLGPPGGS